jgi:hypothetical protein
LDDSGMSCSSDGGSVELLRPDQCLRKLETLSVALECALVRGPYYDDPLRAGNLQFQVRIVGPNMNFA